MDVVLIAAAGVLAPFVVFALWRLIPSDLDVTWSPAHWASRIRPGRKTAAKSEARVDPVEHTGTPMSRPILAEHPDGRVAVGPGKGSVQDVDPNGVRFDGLSFPGRPGRSGSPSRNRGQAAMSRPEPQWPAADATNGYIRPSSQQACPRCQDSASRGAAYCHACGRRLASDATSVPTEQGPALAEGAEQPPKEGGRLTHPEVASFGKELAALAAFARD